MQETIIFKLCFWGKKKKLWFLAFEYCILENLTAFTISVLNFIPVCYFRIYES